MNYRHLQILASAVFGLTIMGAGCAASAPAPQNYQTPAAPTPAAVAPARQPSANTAIAITNFSFQPADITIKTGTTITFTNNDSAPHTITADDASFDSGRLATGATFEHTFTQIGKVSYHCAIHSSMRGTITVTQ